MNSRILGGLFREVHLIEWLSIFPELFSLAFSFEPSVMTECYVLAECQTEHNVRFQNETFAYCAYCGCCAYCAYCVEDFALLPIAFFYRLRIDLEASQAGV